ncbi:unnamed protein product [Thlaspi arvense]|uniref:FBD domain-containing protein n=1 Tax=Thlaspi arvense TaxID=13288 RepID=A0AAU9SIP3_THLAR|nr:unnamed protein product [Thlaspi arvense]
MSHTGLVHYLATVILSKRWRHVWTMLPKLVYTDSDYRRRPGKKENILWFIGKSLQLHKAHVLESLAIELGPRCSDYVNVGKWVEIAADRRIRRLNLRLSWLSEPNRLPKRLYICNTFVVLTIFNKIFVDVPSQNIFHKDEDALGRLLSACPVLKQLYVRLRRKDNLINISVAVPSLETFYYTNLEEKNIVASLVIDCASLRTFFIQDVSGSSCTIENNKRRLDHALISVFRNLDDKFRTSLSSVKILYFILHAGAVDCCNTINFSRLKACNLKPCALHWLAPLMCLLENSPNLEVLIINQRDLKDEDSPLTFNQPSCVPKCLSNHLEIFEFEVYRGRSGEKDVVRYIFANSKRLKRAGIAIEPSCDRRKMMKEVESMSRVSKSSQLLFSTTQFITENSRPGEYGY